MTDQERREAESRDPAMISLQEALNQMAAEVPEMPESFRRGWREALRAEQAGAEKAEKPLGFAASPSKRRTVSWRRALSAAAVAAFVLGGTLLGQDAVQLEKRKAPEARTAVVATEIPGNSLSANGSVVSEGPLPETAAKITEALDAEQHMMPTGALDADLGADLPQLLSMSASDEDSGAEEAPEEAMAEAGGETADRTMQEEAAEEAAIETADRAETAEKAETGAEEETAAEETAAAGADAETAGEAADDAEPETAAETPAEETAVKEETAEEEAAAGAETTTGGARPLRIAGIALILCSLALAAVLLSKKREKDKSPS